MLITLKIFEGFYAQENIIYKKKYIPVITGLGKHISTINLTFLTKSEKIIL